MVPFAEFADIMDAMFVWVIVVVCVLGANPPGASPDGGGLPPRGADRSSSPDDDKATTAEDILRALQRRRPSNEVVPPGSARTHSANREKDAKARLLLPEGFSLVDRTGQLVRGEPWWQFMVDDDESPVPLRMLPNAQLEVMVRTVSGSPSPVRFRIVAELTVFEGENYMLVRVASRVSAPPPPTPASGGDRIPADADADKVLEKLRLQQPHDAVLPPGGPTLAGEARRGVGATQALLLDGSALIQRVGRLVRGGGPAVGAGPAVGGGPAVGAAGWTFVADSDRLAGAEAPLRLLPNLAMQTMVDDAALGGGGSVFTVSGEITLYEGENYLLPRVALRRIDIGNLRR